MKIHPWTRIPFDSISPPPMQYVIIPAMRDEPTVDPLHSSPDKYYQSYEVTELLQ